MRVIVAVALAAALGVAGCQSQPARQSQPAGQSQPAQQSGPSGQAAPSGQPGAGASRSAPAPGHPDASNPSAPAGEGSADALPDVPSLRPADTLGAQIRRAEAIIADPASPPSAVRRAGEFQQLAARALAAAGGGVRRRVMSTLRGRAAAVTSANVTAATALGALSTPAPRLPHDWRIIAPLAPNDLLRLYRAAQRRTGVPWQYLAAINFVETRFGRIAGPSTAGAQGPMQFIPATWARYGAGGDIHDPHDAIPAAARLLVDHGAPGDMTRALLAYNDSTAYVAAVTAYARVMRRWPHAFEGYWSWRVLYGVRHGTYVLPVGYPRVPASRLPSP